MGEMLLSFGAIAVAAILGSHLFRFLAERYGQNVAFAVMAIALAGVFLVQTFLERG